MFVIPAEGCLVPDPARSDLLPETGRNVDPSTYWLRRLAAGEVIEKTESAPEPLIMSAEPAAEPETTMTDKKSVKK